MHAPPAYDSAGLSDAARRAVAFLASVGFDDRSSFASSSISLCGIRTSMQSLPGGPNADNLPSAMGLATSRENPWRRAAGAIGRIDAVAYGKIFRRIGTKKANCRADTDMIAVQTTSQPERFTLYLRHLTLT